MLADSKCFWWHDSFSGHYLAAFVLILFRNMTPLHLSGPLKRCHDLSIQHRCCLLQIFLFYCKTVLFCFLVILLYRAWLLPRKQHESWVHSFLFVVEYEEETDLLHSETLLNRSESLMEVFVSTFEMLPWGSMLPSPSFLTPRPLAWIPTVILYLA